MDPNTIFYENVLKIKWSDFLNTIKFFKIQVPDRQIPIVCVEIDH